MRKAKDHLGAIAIAAGLALGGLSGTALADDWKPTRPIEIIVPSGPGGGLDLAGRTLQAVMQEKKLSPEPITVLNKPGGSGTVGIAYANTHPGNGHYVGVQALPLITNRLSGQSEIGLDDVTPLAQLLTEQIIFSVSADSPIKNGQDLVAMLHKDPSSVSVGVSSSPGGQSHIAAALVLQAAGEDPTKLKIVFFDSGGEAATALMGNHITVAVTPAAVVLGPSQAGKVRMIALPAANRQKGALADVPTWKEQGIDVEFATWRVLVGPKGMTPEQIAWWDDALGKATSSPEWAAAADRNLWTQDYKNSKDLKAFLDQEQTQLGALLKQLGLAK